MTTQVRSTLRRTKMHRRQRHLNAHGDELQPRKGSTMRRHLFSFAVLALVISTFVSIQSGQAQTPQAAVNHYNNALKKTGRGDLDGAIEDYTRAITLSSRFDTRKEDARGSGNSFVGSESSSEAIRVIDPFTANAYNNRGLARYKKGDYPGAIEDFNEALRIRPALPAAYLNRAAAFRAAGDLQNALKDLDRAISLKKDFFEAYNNRGTIHSDLGNEKEALADLNHAIELNDRVAETFYQRAHVYLVLNNFDASIKDLDRAIKLSPDMAWAYYGRGTALMKKAQLRPAIDDFTRALELNPKLVWAYFNRGLALLVLGNEAEAQSDFEASLKLRPELKPQLEQKIEFARHLRRLGKQ